MLNSIKTSWDIENLIKDEKKAQIEIYSASYRFIDKWKNRKDYLKDPNILKSALLEYEAWLRNYANGGNLGYYYSLKNALDQTDPNIKAKLAKIEEQTLKIENDIQFFEYRLSKITPKQQKIFLESEILKTYHHFLETLFTTAKYLLSEKEEKILNLTSDTSYSNWVKMTFSLLSKEQRNKKTLSELLSSIDSQDKKERDSAALALNDIFSKNTDMAENELNSILQSKKILDTLKTIKRPDLPRLISDDIKTEIVDSLLKTVSSRFDISQKYYQLKSKLMGVEKLKYHERNVDYGKIEGDYSFEETSNILFKVLHNLDPQFSKIFTDLIENGQVDVYPKLGKSGGAFCAGGLISQPDFILLNHTNTFSDVLTLAHETGHAIHNTLSKKTQTPLNYGISLAVAETASTFIEDFALDTFLKNASPEEKLLLYMKKLNSDISTIFRQTACYNFEWDLHKEFREKGYLSKEEIGSLFQKHMRSYMGDFVEQGKGSENWWVYWHHIRTFFYVYSYVSGLLISKNLQKQVKTNPKNIEGVRSILSAGNSKSPYNLFKEAGVDIKQKNFWHTGISEVEKLLNETENLALKLKKI
ncbi:MAG: M3 family oligoendopeptidase [bacterium]